MQRSNISVEVGDTEIDDVEGADVLDEEVQHAFDAQAGPAPSPQRGRIMLLLSCCWLPDLNCISAWLWA